MADEMTPQTEPTGEDEGMRVTESKTEPTQPKTEHDALEKDWKAESRKWEDRAKDNLKKLEDLKKQQSGEDAGLKTRVSELEKENESLKVKVRISAETGVPVDLLHGVTEDDISASAKAVSDFAATFAKAQNLYPQDKGGAAQAQAVDVNSIENPLEYVRTRTKQLTNK